VKLEAGPLWGAASDVANFLACGHLTRLDLLSARGQLRPPHEYDAGFHDLVARGEAHERAVLAGFLAGDGASPRSPLSRTATPRRRRSRPSAWGRCRVPGGAARAASGWACTLRATRLPSLDLSRPCRAGLRCPAVGLFRCGPCPAARLSRRVGGVPRPLVLSFPCSRGARHRWPSTRWRPLCRGFVPGPGVPL
jgi:hypothetical protein